MSDVKWCDVGQHPFTTAREGWIHTQAAVKVKNEKRVADLDVCADCAPSSIYGGMVQDEPDPLEKRLQALESRRSQDEREELARLREWKAQMTEKEES